MGEIIRLECQKCGNSYELFTGAGMKDNDLEKVLGHFDEAAANDIRQKLSGSNKNDDWSYRSMIGYCSSCRTYRSIPTFNMSNKTVTTAKCECKAVCELFDEAQVLKGTQKLNCPQCNGMMTATSTGMWD